MINIQKKNIYENTFRYKYSLRFITEFFDIKIIVTRDKKGFEKSKIKIATPKEFLESF